MNVSISDPSAARSVQHPLLGVSNPRQTTPTPGDLWKSIDLSKKASNPAWPGGYPRNPDAPGKYYHNNDSVGPEEGDFRGAEGSIGVAAAISIPILRKRSLTWSRLTAGFRGG